jgi:PIN like domain
MGARAVEALAQAGYDVRSYADHFRGSKDEEWLPAVGDAHWVVITKDQNIRRNQLEIDAILNAGVRAFVVTAGGMHRENQVGLLLRVMPKICRICHQRGPFIFNITGSGLVTQVSNRKLRRRSKG